jgi:hypothetical protein
MCSSASRPGAFAESLSRASEGKFDEHTGACRALKVVKPPGSFRARRFLEFYLTVTVMNNVAVAEMN